MSFGLSSGGGQVRYALIVDDQATAKLNTFKNSLTSLGAGTTKLSRDLTVLNNSFSAGLIPIKNTGNALNQLTTTQKTLGQQLGGLGTAFKNNALAIGAAASSVLGLYQNYANLSSAQNAANKASTAATAALNKVDDLTRKLTATQNKYGKSSKEAAAVQADLNIAIERSTNKVESAKIAQDNLNQTMADFGINILPNIILAGGSIVSIFDNIGGKATGLTGAFTKMKSTLGSLSTSLGTSKLGFLGMAGAIGAAAIAAADLFDLLQKGAEVKALNDIITAGKATEAQLEQQIKNIAEMKKRWDIQIFDFFKSGPIGKAALGDTFKTVGDEVIKSLESQISRIEAKKPLEKLFATITGGAIPPSAKTDIQNQIKHILAILDNPTNWQNPEFTKTSQAIVQDLIRKLGNSINSVDATAGLTGAMRTMFTKIFKGVEFGDSPMTKLFAVDPAPIAASLDPIGKLYKATMNKIVSSSTTGTHQLVADSQFVAKMDELAWGAPASSRFANLKAVGSAAYNEIEAKATEAAAKAKAAWDAAQAAFKQGLTSAQTNIKGVFKIESNADKILKDLIKGLPNKAEKEIKLNLKFGQSIDDTKKAFNDLLFQATQVSDETADASAQKIIDTIDKKFKGSKGQFAGLRALLVAAIADPNTPEKLKQLLMNFNWDSIGVKINKDIQTGVNKTPLTVEVKATLAGFLQGGKSRFSGTAGGNKILESLGLKPEDLKIMVPPPDISKVSPELQKISSIVVPPPNETKYQQGLQLAINNAEQTFKLIGSTLKKISSIQVPPPNETKYQKGLQLAINNAAQTVKFIKKELDKIGGIKVPAPKFNNFNSALDQAVSDTKRAVREINNALKNINKPKSGGGGDGHGPGATTGPFAQGGTVIANQRTTATFGEAGPELAMFVPLKGGGMRSVGSGSAGGGNVEVVNIINIMDETIMRRITARSGRNRFALGV